MIDLDRKKCLTLMGYVNESNYKKVTCYDTCCRYDTCDVAFECRSSR